MNDRFIDSVVEKLLVTYTVDDLDPYIDSLKDGPYQQLARELKTTYAIRPYGRRSKIRQRLEEVLMIKYWDLQLEEKLDEV